MWAVHHSNLPDLATPSDADITPVPFFSDIYTSGSLPVKSMLYTVSGQFSILFQDGWSSDWQEKLERVQQCLHSGVFQIHFGSEMWVGTFTQSWKLQRNNWVLQQILPFMILFCICFYSLCIVFGFVSKQKLHLPGLAMSTIALVDHLDWVAETFHVFYSRWLQTTSW